MKKFAAIVGLLVVLLVGLLAGCASEKASEEESGTATTASSASAEGPEAFYEGETVTLIVPYKPGGGYDTYARLVSGYLEDELQATVIVRNMFGGQTYVANRHVYNAEPNGLTIMIADTKAMIMNQMIAAEVGEGIDVRKFEWLGRVIAEPAVLLLSKKSGLETVEDLRAADHVKFGGTTMGDRNQMAGSVVLESLGLDGEVVVGFGGSSAVSMAAMRGELDGMGSSASSGVEYADQPELFQIFTVSREKNPVSPDLPTIEEAAGLGAEEMKWVDALDTVTGAGRAFVTSPGVPEDRVRFMETALANVLQNEDLLAQAAEIDRPISYASGEEIGTKVNDLLSMPEDEVKEIEDVLLHKYVQE